MKNPRFGDPKLELERESRENIARERKRGWTHLYLVGLLLKRRDE